MGMCFCIGAACGEFCCPEGTTCKTGYCCEPKCQYKSCGNDGCGGTCGGCIGGQVCFDFACTDAGSECDDGNAVDYDGCTQGYITSFIVDSESLLSQGEPDLAVLADGSFVVVWTSYWYDVMLPLVPADGDGRGGFARRFAGNGTPLGAVFAVNTYTDDDQDDSHVAALTSGGFVVVWVSDGEDGDGMGIYARRFAADGMPSDAFKVNLIVGGNQMNPEVAPLPNGGFVVAYESYEGDPTAVQLRGRFVDSLGALVGDDFVLNKSLFGYHFGPPGIDCFADGSFVMTWSISKQISIYQNVVAALFDANAEMVQVGQE